VSKKTRGNPLLAQPPVVGKHRGGSRWTEDVEREFGYMMRDFPPEAQRDIYWGVHVSCEPFTAMAYALNYRLLTENDWGLDDVGVPAVLLAFGKLPKKKLTNFDLDVLGTAKDLLAVAAEFSDAIGEDFDLSGEPDWGEVKEWAAEHEGFREIAGDYGRSNYEDVDWALEESSLGGIAGDFANRPDATAFFDAAMSMAFWEHETGDTLDSEEARKVAVDMAGRLVPQRRYLGDIDYEYLVGFVIVPGFGGVSIDEHSDWTENVVSLHEFTNQESCKPLDPREIFRSFDSVWEASNDLLDVAFKLGCIYTVTGERVEESSEWEKLRPQFQWWHGTNLDRAMSAFPKAFPRTKHFEFVFDGSFRCAPEFEDEDDGYRVL